MKIAISAESTIDFTKELLAEYNIRTLPYSVILKDREGFDGVDISTDDIIDSVNKTGVLPKTGAVNEAQFTEHFSKILKDSDAIVHFTLSSHLSSAYNNAVAASKKFKNVYVVDSLSLSSGIGLLAIYGAKLAAAGFSAQEIAEKCRERVPFVQVSSELKRIDYLYRGGRCSALCYYAANLLKIRPQILVKEGKLVTGKKYRGNFSKVVDKYCKDVLQQFDNPDLEEAFLTYTTADAEVINIAKQHLIDRGFKNIHVTRAGATVTSHTGEDCLGIYYINDGGKNI